MRSCAAVHPRVSGNTLGLPGGSQFQTVHPRVCGEHRGEGRADYAGAGSSPRVRGTPGTPAAFTSKITGSSPRGGEHDSQHLPEADLFGSSPRVRGTPCQPRPGTSPHRFIPACAGNTTAVALSGTWGPVHPRVCGEHLRRLLIGQQWLGSSPRVRGTPAQPLLNQQRPRFIPACAGNTYRQGARTHRGSVHPRVCGEHWLGGQEWQASGGSSPRVRGTPCPLAQVPAHIGSSPRVRGTLREVRICPGARRFIPACAGNTPKR